MARVGSGEGAAPTRERITKRRQVQMARGWTPEEYWYDQQTARHTGRGVLMQKTRTVKSGDYIDVEIFPVIDREYDRTEKRKPTPERMRAVNLRNARKQLTRLCQCNFGPGDLFSTFTCKDPCSGEEMQRITRNFIARLRREYRKAGKELRYIYVIESTGDGDRQRHHIHMILNGGLDRDAIEKIWRHGLANSRRIQDQDMGLGGLAVYMTRAKAGQEKALKRRWAASRGLKKPVVTESKSKFSRAAAARIAQAVSLDARAEFEKRYPGYRLVEQPLVRYSDFLPGVYIYATMKRIT